MSSVLCLCSLLVVGLLCRALSYDFQYSRIYQRSAYNVGPPKCSPSQDRLSSCSIYLKLGFCHRDRYRDYMKTNCAMTCGWCCAAGTHASGPYHQGCPCVTNINPQSQCFADMKKSLCSAAGHVGSSMRIRCSATCGYCCADGTLGSGPFKEGCLEKDQCHGKNRLNATLCDGYRRKSYCHLDSTKDWMKYYCESACKWCCNDGKTYADGPGQYRCAYKLCYNKLADEYCANKTNTSATFCDKKINQDDCAWTCRQCKAQGPRQLCEQLPPSKIPYGCCWDGKPALAPKDGCRYCGDRYPHVCGQYEHRCITGQYRLRTFMEQYCPAKCKFCKV